jgi:MFS family permease
MGDAAGPCSPASMTKLALTGLAGTSIEWYDFLLYGVGSALVFPTLFFPKSLPHSIALLASFSTFAVGFLARPIGAIVFGHLGDRLGRTTALAIALALMGVATTLIGCLPPYAMIGASAPALLVLLRFAQGLAIGGQWSGAMLLVVENAPAAHRGYWGSFAQSGAPAGVVLANLAFLLVGALTPADAFLTWAWRLPFFLSILLVALGWYVHRRVEDTPVYREHQRASCAGAAVHVRSPVLEALRCHPREILLAAGSFVASNILFYIVTTFAVAYATNPDGLHISRTAILTAVLIGTGGAAPFLVVFGALSDRFGRRRVAMTGAVLTALSGFALFPLLATKSVVGMAAGVALLNASGNMMYGPQAALFGELFRTKVRYSCASLGYQLGAIFGGALAPLIATGLFAAFHSTIGIAAYMATACLISFISVGLLGETAGGSLRGEIA